MSSKFAWILNQITNQIWFRVSLYGLVAVATVAISSLVGDHVPEGIAKRVGDGTARSILSIIASSMLVVATFSLGSMVQAYAAASSSATPRATQILIDDAFSQNVISTFLGAFVFSMVGILALSLDFYTRGGEFVLVIVSSVVIFLVIGSLFGWLDHLANLVRLGEISKKVAYRAETILRARAKAPRLGGVPPDGRDENAHAIMPDRTGYVRHIDVYRLQEAAKKADGVVRLDAMPGTLADPTSPLVRTSWAPDEAEVKRIRTAFTIGPERSFDQDPRFCVQVLSEIASRALSPGINDPGTAIAVVALQHRLLATWHEIREDPEPASCDRVMAPALEASQLFEDAFGPLLRDGAGLIEVEIEIQKTLHRLGALGSKDFADAARRHSQLALAHSEKALDIREDRERLHKIVAELKGEMR